MPHTVGSVLRKRAIRLRGRCSRKRRVSGNCWRQFDQTLPCVAEGSETPQSIPSKNRCPCVLWIVSGELEKSRLATFRVITFAQTLPNERVYGGPSLW